MNNYAITRNHIEGLILSCFLNQHRTLELDKMEYEAYKLPFELFKANYTHRIVAKAIYNLQLEKKPVDENIVHDYLTKRVKFDELEYLALHSYTWVSFETMLMYLRELENINREDEKIELLKGLR